MPDFSAPDIATLHAVLCDFIADEAKAGRTRFSQHITRPVAERITDERCLDQLTFAGEAEQGGEAFAFRCGGRGNSARFREGDRVRLHRGEPDANPLRAILVHESESQVWLRPDGSNAAFRAAVCSLPQDWILDEDYFDSYALLKRGLDDAIATATGRDRVLSLFAGTSQGEMDLGLEAFEAGLGYGEAAGLNDSQTEALAQAISSRHSHLVQGPPGTGKTYVLAQAIAALVEKGERVLLTSFTHRAIHHALAACHRTIGDLARIAKVGIPVHDPALAPVRQYENFSKTPLRHLQSGGYVCGATAFSAAGRRMAGTSFDTVVIDEASQMTIPLAVLAMLHGRKFLFFGDQRQLPPVLQSIPPADAASWSVFGSLAQHSDYTTLDTTYRMNADLTAWPSTQFYSGRLLTAPACARRTLPLPNRTPTHTALLATASRVFLELAHTGSRTACAEEAAEVVAVVADALACGLPATEIGIVTPFRRQARLIKRRLRTLTPDAADIVADTVERFQGQERELVIVSFTTSDPAFLDRVGGFFFQSERLNVAITRARSKLVLIGSALLRTFEPTDPALEESVARFSGLLEDTEKL